MWERPAAAMPTTRDITDEDLLRLPKDGQKYELVDGQIRVSPAGARHGQVIVKLGARLLAHATAQGLGFVFDSSTGFRWRGRKPGPKNLRSPDVSFVASGRWPNDEVPVGFPELAPDLAVEVLSPDDRPRDVLEKVGEYLEVGSRLVWVLDYRKRTAAVYRSLTDVRHPGENDDLDGEDVIPGFSCPLAEIF